MAVDFAKLGKTKLGEIPRPPKEPAGVYHGVVRSWKWAESRWRDKETNQTEAQIHFTIKPTEAEVDLPDTIKLANLIHVAEVSVQSDAQVYYMQEFLRSLGVDIVGKDLDQALPETIGANVTYDVVVKDGEKGQIVNIRKLRARVA